MCRHTVVFVFPGFIGDAKPEIFVEIGVNRDMMEGEAAYQLGNTSSRTITEVKQR